MGYVIIEPSLSCTQAQTLHEDAGSQLCSKSDVERGVENDLNANDPGLDLIHDYQFLSHQVCLYTVVESLCMAQSIPDQHIDLHYPSNALFSYTYNRPVISSTTLY